MTNPVESNLSEIYSKQNKQLLVHYFRQPYTAKIREYEIDIFQGVFPSDISCGTGLLMDAISQFIKANRVNAALDMGTGPGILAIHMANLKIPLIYAADNHKPAIDCARHNFKKHQIDQQVKLLESDLFTAFGAGEQFDLVVFNHYFYPIEGANFIGTGNEGGRPLIIRFLDQASYRTHHILMPFPKYITSEHDPRVIATELELETEIISRVEQGDKKWVIYHITL